MLNKVINLENVSFSYRDEEHFLMKDLNLKIPVGKTIAIVGPSGAGKSTVADLIMGLIQPYEGKITLIAFQFLNVILDHGEVKLDMCPKKHFYSMKQ